MEHHIDPWMGIFFPYANFVLFLVLAVYFFRKPALAAAAKRREDYQKLVREATSARDEATRQLNEQKARLARLDQEIAEIKTMSRQSAEVEAAKIVSDAERLAAHLREEARRIAEAEVSSARAALRQEVVAAVRDGVARKISSEVKSDTHLSIVRKQIGELQTIKTGG